MSPSSRPTDTVLVWDLPTRVIHWLLALSFLGAYVTSGEDDWETVHFMLGYTMLGLAAFRILWGLAGSRYARFSEFVAGPAKAINYLRSLHTPQPQHYVGHNPAGGLAILALLGLILLTGASGWLHYKELAGEWMEELHQVLGNTLLTLVIIHIAAVIASSRLHKENLARAMVTGYKQGTQKDAISGASKALGVVILLAVIGFWIGYYSQEANAPKHSHEEQHDDHD